MRGSQDFQPSHWGCGSHRQRAWGRGWGRGARIRAPSPLGHSSNDPVGQEQTGGREGRSPGLDPWAPSQPHTVQPHGPRRRRAALGPAAESGVPGGGGGPRPDFDRDDRDSAGQFPLPEPNDPQLPVHRPDGCLPEEEGNDGGRGRRRGHCRPPGRPSSCGALGLNGVHRRQWVAVVGS